MVPPGLTRRNALRLSSVSLLGLAGCTTRESDETLTLTQSPPTLEDTTPVVAGEVESIPVDHPALVWAVGLPMPLSYPPAVDSDMGRIYIGVGDAGLPPPDEDGSDAPFGALYCLRAEDGAERWGISTAAPVAGQPVVNDGRIHLVTGFRTLFSGTQQRIVAYSRNGTRRWKTHSPYDTLSILAASDDTIFAGTDDDAGSTEGQQLFAIRSDGEIRWEREAGDARGAAVVNDNLLYSAGNLALVSYDVETGTTDWQIGEEPIGNQREWIVTFDERCFTQARDDEENKLVARSAIDGSEQWRYAPESSPENAFVPTVIANAMLTGNGSDGGASIIGMDYGGLVFALDDEGTERWTFTTEADTSDRLVVGDAVYVSDRAGNVYALNPANGRERWRVSLPDLAYVFPLPEGVLAFVEADARSILVSLRRDGSQRWRYSTTRDLRWPVVEGNRAYIGATDGSVHVFDTMG